MQSHRFRLVANLAAVQLFCLGWALFLFATWLHGSIRTTVHDQVLADNVQTVRQMTSLIREMDLGDIRQDSHAWGRLQDVIRDIKLPNEGYVCLVDDQSGQILCHPSLETQPQIEPRKVVGITGASTMLAMVSGGVIGEGDRLEIVAAAEIPAMGARVLVHQRGPGIDRAVAKLTSPILPVGLAASVALVAATSGFLWVVIRRYDDRLARANEELESRVEQRTRALRKTRDAVIFGLAKLAESRDTDTGEHLERIRTYATLLAEQLRDDGIALDDRTVAEIGLASSLHDIGKVGVADRVLLKPGRLDAEERLEIEKHALLGGDCLAAIGERLGEDDFLQLAKEIAYGHHERWDGGGYPTGVAGEAIPLPARIVALADVYDALRSRRPYKEPMSHEEARSILLEGRGAHFDPLVIEAFLACEDRFVAISERSNAASTRDHAGVSAKAPDTVLA